MKKATIFSISKLMMLFLFVLIIQINSLHSHTKSTRTFKINNKCSQSLWIGAMGNPNPSSTGFMMAPKSTYELKADPKTAAMRIWARTGCKNVNGKLVCDSGDCGSSANGFGVQCKGISGQSPATLIQLTLGGWGGADFYDLSNVDGNNLNVAFGPIEGSYKKVNNPSLGKFNCGHTKCMFDINKCPPELRKQTPTGAFCMSICAAVNDAEQVKKYPNILGPIAKDSWKNDLVCCACGPNAPGGCYNKNSRYCCSPFDQTAVKGGVCHVENWPKPSSLSDRYDKVFKDQCPDAYSWQFDDHSSTYQCVDADYYIDFCPDGSPSSGSSNNVPNNPSGGSYNVVASGPTTLKSFHHNWLVAKSASTVHLEGHQQKWTWQYLGKHNGEDLFSWKSSFGTYLSARDNGSITLMPQRKAWQIWVKIDKGSFHYWKSKQWGNYMSARQDGSVNLQAKPDTWEQWIG